MFYSMTSKIIKIITMLSPFIFLLKILLNLFLIIKNIRYRVFNKLRIFLLNFIPLENISGCLWISPLILWFFYNKLVNRILSLMTWISSTAASFFILLGLINRLLSSICLLLLKLWLWLSFLFNSFYFLNSIFKAGNWCK